MYGLIGELADDRVHVNFTYTERENLNTQLERMYNEEFGDINTALEEGMSVEDRKAKEIMDQSATLVNGHYQIRLPFRQEFLSLPDSLPTAEKRLKWLKGEMQRDPGCLPFTRTIRLEISGINIKHLNATLRERESPKTLSTSVRET